MKYRYILVGDDASKIHGTNDEALAKRIANDENYEMAGWDLETGTALVEGLDEVEEIDPDDYPEDSDDDDEDGDD